MHQKKQRQTQRKASKKNQQQQQQHLCSNRLSITTTTNNNNKLNVAPTTTKKMTQASEFRCHSDHQHAYTREQLQQTVNGLKSRKCLKPNCQRGLQYKCHCGEWIHCAQMSIHNKTFHSPSTIPPVSKTATKETIPQNLIKTTIADVDITQPGRIIIHTVLYRCTRV